MTSADAEDDDNQPAHTAITDTQAPPSGPSQDLHATPNGAAQMERSSTATKDGQAPSAGTVQPGPRQLSSQQAANRAMARHHSLNTQSQTAGSAQSNYASSVQSSHAGNRESNSAGNVNVQQSQQGMGHLDLHHSDIWSPLGASAPHQVSYAPTQEACNYCDDQKLWRPAHSELVVGVHD